MMKRVGAFFSLFVEVDQAQYEDVVGGRYSSDEEVRAALEQSVSWSLEEGKGNWCELGRDVEVIVAPSQAPTYVNVYVLERPYGGPEEGGWYYEAGFPYLSVDVTSMSEDDRRELVEALTRAYPDERKRSSVLYGRDGYDYQVVVEEHEARQWPEEAPRYE
jgi:hypothetical protein